jgi:hypothetical protein
MPDEGHDLLGHVAVVGFVAGAALRRGHRIVVPRFAVYAVDAVELDLACVDKARDFGHHAHALEIEIAPPGAGKDDEGFAPVPVDLELHVAVQARAAPVMMFDVHGRGSSKPS